MSRELSGNYDCLSSGDHYIKKERSGPIQGYHGWVAPLLRRQPRQDMIFYGEKCNPWRSTHLIAEVSLEHTLFSFETQPGPIFQLLARGPVPLYG